MNADFNNLRKQACVNYSRLVRKINSHINDDGEIRVNAYQLQELFDELHNSLAWTAACFIDGNDDFKCIVDEIVMVDFNPCEEVK